ncbi:hypothetical protein N0V90_008195 [Kalmusia sp. IMI 367209]|nr:hypothetical protein N0V90_008195 [Kalmusia sp. IMI 367209]
MSDPVQEDILFHMDDIFQDQPSMPDPSHDQPSTAGAIQSLDMLHRHEYMYKPYHVFETYVSSSVIISSADTLALLDTNYSETIAHFDKAADFLTKLSNTVKHLEIDQIVYEAQNASPDGWWCNLPSAELEEATTELLRKSEAFCTKALADIEKYKAALRADTKKKEDFLIMDHIFEKEGRVGRSGLSSTERWFRQAWIEGKL